MSQLVYRRGAVDRGSGVTETPEQRAAFLLAEHGSDGAARYADDMFMRHLQDEVTRQFWSRVAVRLRTLAAGGQLGKPLSKADRRRMRGRRQAKRQAAAS